MKHIYPVLVAIVVSILSLLLFIYIGAAFALIVGGSAILAYFVWLLTTYPYPVNGQKILPLFIFAITMQFIHMTEEFVAGFPSQFSAFTGSNFTPDTFVLISVLGGGIVYTLAGLGLLRRHPIANYVLWFFLIGPAGLINSIAHFLLPILSGRLYFPGLITVLLPTIVGTTLAWRIIQDSRKQRAAEKTPNRALVSA